MKVRLFPAASYGSAARMKGLYKITMFRKGPFSAVKPVEAQAGKEKNGSCVPAKVRLMSEDCQELMKHSFVLLIQSLNIRSHDLEALRSLCLEHRLRIKFVQTKVLSNLVETDASLNQFKPISEYLHGQTIAAYSNEDPQNLGKCFAALKSHPHLILLGGKFEDRLFSHEGLQDIIFNIPKRKVLQEELVSILSSTPSSLAWILSVPATILSTVIASSNIEPTK